MSARKSYLIETSQNPEGNHALLARKLEEVFEQATNKERPSGITLGVLQLVVSEVAGMLAGWVWQSWTKGTVDYAPIKEGLYKLMVYCVLALEAMETNEGATK